MVCLQPKTLQLVNKGSYLARCDVSTSFDLEEFFFLSLSSNTVVYERGLKTGLTITRLKANTQKNYVNHKWETACVKQWEYSTEAGQHFSQDAWKHGNSP